MGRLIDADALKQDLRKCQIESLIAHTEEKNVFDVINEQPTAYDVEKVMDQLEEERGISYADFDEYAYRYELDLTDNDDWFYKGLERAKRIITELAKEYKIFGNSEQVKVSEMPTSWVIDGKGIHKQTNADRIRSMTDEELAEFLCKISMCKPDYCPAYLECMKTEYGTMTTWFQSEAE